MCIHFKRLAGILLALIMLLSVTACQNAVPNQSGTSVTESKGSSSAAQGTTPSAEAKKVTLNIITYHVGTDYAAGYYTYLFDTFLKTEAGKNVKFNFEEIPSVDSFNQKIKLLIGSGDLPDIVFSGGNNITEMAARSGKVADLTPYFDADPEWKARFDDLSLKFNTVDGKIYGVPISKEISYIYYNKELFKKAGVAPAEVAYETWDDFFAVCDKLKAAGITPVAMDSGDLAWLSNLWFCALIATQNAAGNEWMNTMYPTNFETPEVIAAATTLQKMLTKYTTPDAVGGTYDPMATHFFNSAVAMFPNGPWMIPDFSQPEKAPADFYDKLGIMLMPKYGMVTVPTPGEMVGTHDPVKVDAAVAFLKFETSAENQLKQLEMAGSQPVSDNIVVPDSLRASNRLMSEVLDIQSKAKITYGQNQAYWQQNVVDEFVMQLPELAYSNITPAEFCARLTKASLKN